MYYIILGLLLFLCGGPLAAAIPSGRTTNILLFGATPDDASDDTDAINAAIRSLALSGGGTLFIPRGTFIVNSRAAQNPLRTRSHIRFLGQRDLTSGQIVSILKMPRGQTNRSLLVIGDPNYADESTDLITDPRALQEDIEIADLAFDLDNDHGRRAIQLRYLTREIYIHDCEGFQSGLDRGEAIDTSARGDNHFLNLGCYAQPRLGLVPENVTIERCSVRGNLQLTADGGGGVINLTICDNQVSGAFSHGIAVTTVSPEAFFSNIIIINNRVLSIGGDGIYVSQDRNDQHHFTFQEGMVNAMSQLMISGNTLELGPNSAPNAGGIHIGSFIALSDVEISLNTLRGYDGGETSRFALTIGPWDYNWNRDHHYPVISSSSFLTGSNQLRMPDHGLMTGMQVAFFAESFWSKLPSGLEAYRRYIVNYIDKDTFTLTASRGGPAISFGAEPGVGTFFVAFSPGIERLKLSHNTVSGVWNYGLVLHDSVEADISSNDINHVVAIAGAHESIAITNNDFASMFICTIPATEPGCSFLGPSLGATPGRMISSISNNRWRIDEAILGTVYGYTAAVNFDPGDTRRRMDYSFIQNRVSFASTAHPQFRNGVRDRGQPGQIHADYVGNTVERGIDSGAANLASVPRFPLTP